MSKVGNQDSGVVGGTMDVSRDTNVEEPSSLIDESLARRHQAAARGKKATQRNQEKSQAAIAGRNPDRAVAKSGKARSR